MVKGRSPVWVPKKFIEMLPSFTMSGWIRRIGLFDWYCVVYLARKLENSKFGVIKGLQDFQKNTVSRGFERSFSNGVKRIRRFSLRRPAIEFSLPFWINIFGNYTEKDGTDDWFESDNRRRILRTHFNGKLQRGAGRNFIPSRRSPWPGCGGRLPKAFCR